MGAKKAVQVPAKIEGKKGEVLPPMTVTPARLVDEGGADKQEVQGLPAEFQDSDTLEGFPPSAKFDEPGDCVFGEFIGMREGVGPNTSRLYEIAAPNGAGSTFTVAVWGSQALDRLFDMAYPPIQSGDRVAFIFKGLKETKRKLNPVKLFQIKVKRPGQQTQTAGAN